MGFRMLSYSLSLRDLWVCSSPEYICCREGGVNSLWGANAYIPNGCCPYVPCGIEVSEFPVFCGMWLLSAFHSRSESAHPCLMESDDVVLH